MKRSTLFGFILIVLMALTACESEKLAPEDVMESTSIVFDEEANSDMERSGACYEFVGRVSRPLTFPLTITFDRGRTTQVVRTAADLAAIDRRCNQNIRPSRVRINRAPQTRGTLTRGRGR